jgi:hypothetical protein
LKDKLGGLYADTGKVVAASAQGLEINKSQTESVHI